MKMAVLRQEHPKAQKIVVTSKSDDPAVEGCDLKVYDWKPRNGKWSAELDQGLWELERAYVVDDEKIEDIKTILGISNYQADLIQDVEIPVEYATELGIDAPGNPQRRMADTEIALAWAALRGINHEKEEYGKNIYESMMSTLEVHGVVDYASRDWIPREWSAYRRMVYWDADPILAVETIQRCRKEMHREPREDQGGFAANVSYACRSMMDYLEAEIDLQEESIEVNAKNITWRSLLHQKLGAEAIDEDQARDLLSRDILLDLVSKEGMGRCFMHIVDIGMMASDGKDEVRQPQKQVRKALNALEAFVGSNSKITDPNADTHGLELVAGMKATVRFFGPDADERVERDVYVDYLGDYWVRDEDMKGMVRLNGGELQVDEMSRPPAQISVVSEGSTSRAFIGENRSAEERRAKDIDTRDVGRSR